MQHERTGNVDSFARDTFFQLLGCKTDIFCGKIFVVRVIDREYYMCDETSEKVILTVVHCTRALISVCST